MNISTLAKILGVSLKDLRETGQKNSIYGFSGRNTRIPYQSAVEITKILQPDKATKLENDDKIYLPQTITVSNFAETIGKSSGEVVKALLMSGVMVTLNEKIDFDTASLMAAELGVDVFPENPEMFTVAGSDTQLIKTVEYNDIAEDKKEFETRPPVVTVMGHVDHGKTTLLDYIRKANVANGEAGAITQHISSYKANFKGKPITFVDTPGHEAFTAMRARGSQLADFVILVVSAVEGAKPQTIEVIERVKLSKVPLIVAINKIDLPNSDVEKTKTDLTKYGLVPEEWGGETPFIPISAKTGEGIDKLLETLLVFAELAELKGQVNCQGQAITIESYLDRNMGVVCTALVVKDKLKVGDIVRAGEFVSKIRKLINTEGKEVKQATIGDPIVIIGIPEVVNIGEPIIVYEKLRYAQNDAELEKQNRASHRVINFAPKENSENAINVVLKADVAGSLEALKEAIIKIPQEQTQVVIKAESVGEVGETDVEFANTAGSTLLVFHTKISPKAEILIKKLEVGVVQSNIIYELLEWVETEILKRKKHETKKIVLGKAEVLSTFKSDKPTIQIFGGEVKEGKILDNKVLEIYRGEELLGRAEILELQKNKSKVTEVNISQQFGISASSRVKIKSGDIILSVEEQIVS